MSTSTSSSSSSLDLKYLEEVPVPELTGLGALHQSLFEDCLGTAGTPDGLYTPTAAYLAKHLPLYGQVPTCGEFQVDGNAALFTVNMQLAKTGALVEIACVEKTVAPVGYFPSYLRYTTTNLRELFGMRGQFPPPPQVSHVLDILASFGYDKFPTNTIHEAALFCVQLLNEQERDIPNGYLMQLVHSASGRYDEGVAQSIAAFHSPKFGDAAFSHIKKVITCAVRSEKKAKQLISTLNLVESLQINQARNENDRRKRVREVEEESQAEKKHKVASETGMEPDSDETEVEDADFERDCSDTETEPDEVPAPGSYTMYRGTMSCSSTDWGCNKCNYPANPRDSELCSHCNNPVCHLASSSLCSFCLHL